MPELAKQCNFTNPTKCTGQGNGAVGISSMVNSKEIIPLYESMQVAKHSLTEANLGYCEADKEAHSKRYMAMSLNV